MSVRTGSPFIIQTDFFKDIIIPVESNAGFFEIDRIRQTNIAKEIIDYNFTEGSGYIVYSNGLIMQWGTLPAGGSLSTKRYFPKIFTNYVAVIALLPNNASGTSEIGQYVYTYDKTGFIPAVKWAADYTVSSLVRDTKYFAIGF